jgi:transcriptional regulator with XRE-family HTH domain
MSEGVKPQRLFALSPGQWLRALRHERGLKIKDVEEASTGLARTYNNDEFRVSASRLSEIENRDLTPNIYKLYSLAAIYRVAYPELLKHYGIDQQRALQEPVSAKTGSKAVAVRSAGR